MRSGAESERELDTCDSACSNIFGIQESKRRKHRIKVIEKDDNISIPLRSVLGARDENRLLHTNSIARIPYIRFAGLDVDFAATVVHPPTIIPAQRGRTKQPEALLGLSTP